jgi:hypothetical protein
MGTPKLFGEMKLADKQKILPPNGGRIAKDAGAMVRDADRYFRSAVIFSRSESMPTAPITTSSPTT